MKEQFGHAQLHKTVGAGQTELEEDHTEGIQRLEHERGQCVAPLPTTMCTCAARAVAVILHSKVMTTMAAVMTSVATKLHLRPVLIAPMTVIAVTVVELLL